MVSVEEGAAVTGKTSKKLVQVGAFQSLKETNEKPEPRGICSMDNEHEESCLYPSTYISEDI